MLIPDSFAKRLEAAFRGRLRLRWSFDRACWLIEQQVGRAALPARRFDPKDDDCIREADGYALVMEIRRGDRMPCQTCGAELKVPIFEFALTTCARCRARGKDGKKVAGFFDLDDRLLDQLRLIDPERVGPVQMRRRLTQELDQENAETEARRDKGYEAQRYDFLFDAAISQLPMVGYRKGV